MTLGVHLFDRAAYRIIRSCPQILKILGFREYDNNDWYIVSVCKGIANVNDFGLRHIYLLNVRIISSNYELWNAIFLKWP